MTQYSAQLKAGQIPPLGAEVAMPRRSVNGQPAPFRVLIVEDSAPVRQRLLERIKGLASSIEVATAARGEAALAAFSREHVDAVLLDFHLPDLSGYDVLIQMRWMQPACAVFMLTQETYPEFRQHALRLGARQCFHKPTQFELAIEAIRELAPQGAGQDSSGELPGTPMPDRARAATAAG